MAAHRGGREPAPHLPQPRRWPPPLPVGVADQKTHPRLIQQNQNRKRAIERQKRWESAHGPPPPKLCAVKPYARPAPVLLNCWHHCRPWQGFLLPPPRPIRSPPPPPNSLATPAAPPPPPPAHFSALPLLGSPAPKIFWGGGATFPLWAGVPFLTRPVVPPFFSAPESDHFFYFFLRVFKGRRPPPAPPLAAGALGFCSSPVFRKTANQPNHSPIAYVRPSTPQEAPPFLGPPVPNLHNIGFAPTICPRFRC